MSDICDHTSVGILVRKSGTLLLIKRRKPPFGFAPPAGHVDERPNFEIAAASELEEETGLRAISLSLVAEGRRENPCRRVNGNWHYWRIYEAKVTGDIQASPSEVEKIIWSTRAGLGALASRTHRYILGKISPDEWQSNPGLEPVWAEWLKETGDL